jgi:hypothetical protein
VLEDLNRDEIIEWRFDLELAKVRAREPRRHGRAASDELVECLLRHVEPVEVEPGADQRKKVPTVTAADVEPYALQRLGVGSQRGDDLIDERQRARRDVAARPVLGVPARREQLGAQTSPFSLIVFSSHNQM